jgi:hypothetical protein
MIVFFKITAVRVSNIFLSSFKQHTKLRPSKLIPVSTFLIGSKRTLNELCILPTVSTYVFHSFSEQSAIIFLDSINRLMLVLVMWVLCLWTEFLYNPYEELKSSLFSIIVYFLLILKLQVIIYTWLFCKLFPFQWLLGCSFSHCNGLHSPVTSHPSEALPTRYAAPWTPSSPIDYRLVWRQPNFATAFTLTFYIRRQHTKKKVVAAE